MSERRPDTTFWVEAACVEGDRLTLDREESRHLLRVHRARAGTPFEATDGVGNTYSCVLESDEDGQALARITAREVDRGELRAGLHLLVGLPDLGAAESVVQHAVPLGVRSIDFTPCERSGRPALGSARLERLQRLARSGVKQSRRSRLPEIRSSDSLDRALALVPPGRRLAADPDGRPLPADVNGPAQAPITVAVGPPGGFTVRERDRLDAGGFQLISLGPSRLTSETAALALLASVRNLLLHS
ncbi:MAG TPA: RsmE family RNA methyltransferase [Candidatus Eisenbacteria bacterium]|nr:RsmE family RNA methyltransferase [Candidatus Eisenbacteria bacterium]